MKVRCPLWETCDENWCPHYGEHGYIPECAETCGGFDEAEYVLCQPLDDEEDEP